MFRGLEWYWWLVIVIAFVVVLPFKINLLKKISSKDKCIKDDKHD